MHGREKVFPPRLKPDSSCGCCGTAEAVPFQSGAGAEAGGGLRERLEQRHRQEKVIPQRLKPSSFRRLYGPAKARPLQRIEFFRRL